MKRGQVITTVLAMGLAVVMLGGLTIAVSAQERDRQDRERTEERDDEERDDEERDRRRSRYLETRQLLEQVMTARLSKELELDDEQTILLVRRFSEHREQAHERRVEHRRLKRALREAIDEDSEDTDIAATVNALIALDKEEAAGPHVVESLAGKELTAWQRARLYLFMEDFDDDMRDLYEQILRGRRDGPDRPDEGPRGQGGRR